ncbi:MAG: MBL fold metallo-hydrolase [Proteobacteria bacterium]|nr:MBL fold metallo-hydrolase [Pseudomonadota bacterium]
MHKNLSAGPASGPDPSDGSGRISDLAVTVLVDNRTESADLMAEHGLSLLVEFKEDGVRRQVLLDTGQTGRVLGHNLTWMEKHLRDLAAVVLSHGHYDHVGGLPMLLGRLKRPVPVLVHPELWGIRMADGPALRSIGAGFDPIGLAAAGARVIAASGPVPLFHGVLTTGSIQRREPLECSRNFSRLVDDKIIDDQIADDMALVIDLKSEGLVVLTGCCHAGVINTIRHVRDMTGNHRIKALIGGLHLAGAGPDRMRSTLACLAEASPEWVVPLHCSGREETLFLRRHLGPCVIEAGAGRRFDLSSRT